MCDRVPTSDGHLANRHDATHGMQHAAWPRWDREAAGTARPRPDMHDLEGVRSELFPWNRSHGLKVFRRQQYHFSSPGIGESDRGGLDLVEERVDTDWRDVPEDSTCVIKLQHRRVRRDPSRHVLPPISQHNEAACEPQEDAARVYEHPSRGRSPKTPCRMLNRVPACRVRRQHHCWNTAVPSRCRRCVWRCNPGRDIVQWRRQSGSPPEASWQSRRRQ